MYLSFHPHFAGSELLSLAQISSNLLYIRFSGEIHSVFSDMCELKSPKLTYQTCFYWKKKLTHLSNIVIFSLWFEIEGNQLRFKQCVHNLKHQQKDKNA